MSLRRTYQRPVLPLLLSVFLLGGCAGAGGGETAQEPVSQNTKSKEITMRTQLPGAIFTACGWQLISFVFSVYLDIFTGFSTMYGSLTTIILVLLWFYMCMYVILLGGEFNVLLEHDG